MLSTRHFHTQPYDPFMNFYIEAEYESTSWELEKLLDQWPQQAERTLTLLASIEEFFRQGACHWPSPATSRLSVVK